MMYMLIQNTPQWDVMLYSITLIQKLPTSKRQRAMFISMLCLFSLTLLFCLAAACGLLGSVLC